MNLEVPETFPLVKSFFLDDLVNIMNTITQQDSGLTLLVWKNLVRKLYHGSDSSTSGKHDQMLTLKNEMESFDS